MNSGESLGAMDTRVCWLDEETLPEITLLDATCDSTLSGSVLATPATARSVSRKLTPLRPSQLNSSTNLNSTVQISGPQNNTFDLLQSNVSSPKVETETLDTKPSQQNGTKALSDMSLSDSTSDKENNSEAHSPELSKQTTSCKTPNAKMDDPPESLFAPERWLDVRYFPEITLLDVTHDSEQSQVEELSSIEAIRDISPVDDLKEMPPSESSGQIAAEPGRPDQNDDLSSTLTENATHSTISFSEQSDKSVGGNVTQTFLEATPDISTGSVLENSRPSPEPIGPTVEKIQTSAEETLGTRPANVTHDISSSSDVSAASQTSTSDMQCNTSSKNVTAELHGEPVMTSDTVESNNEEPLTSNDAELTSEMPKSSPKPDVSLNRTFTSLQPPHLSSSTDLNTTTPISGPQNTTVDLPSSGVNCSKPESEANDQATSVSINTTFEPKSSKQNGTITLSETSSNVNWQNTFDKLSPPKGCNATSSPKENNSEVHPPELIKHNETNDSTDSDTKRVDTPESTFEAQPAAEVASAVAQHEINDHSRSDVPMTDGLPDTLGHQSMDRQGNKRETINWDSDCLITSTPMPNCKLFKLNTERDQGKAIGTQKKLYGDGPSKTDTQVPSDVPSNIISERKTSFAHPAAKSLVPPSKLAPQLFKHKPASAIPGRSEATSGLPMTRQRTQAEALRTAAGSDAPQATTGISSSYKLRPSTTQGCKLPSSGLQRPQASGLPSGIQRAATRLRPPSARSNAAASSSTNKLRGPTATNPVTKTSQAKRQPLTRDAPSPSRSAEASTSSLPAANGARNLKQPTTCNRALPAKTQKDVSDAAVPASSAAEISTSSCDRVSRARALKQPASSHRGLPPKPKGHGCANCAVLEKQLNMQAEEIRELKELLKKSKEQEC
ncbi:mucin-2-like isoform X2 [Centropristis striata]|uniref:mucin-2-like isoform X2 n=1 Tax=Centropristis striata TaxID=184440 RepID=UPI0027DF2D9C|nr:mucin-2-like isoform X2 [Centropristis striata]